MWHCGPAAPSLAGKGEPVRLTDHPTIRQGMGTAMEFSLKTGTVTMMKLSEGQEGYRMLLESGDAISPDRDLFANQMDVRFKEDANQILARVMEHGFEHHYVLAYGAYEKEMIMLCKWLDVDVIGGNA
jgi:L-fucose isomerase-like protein